MFKEWTSCLFRLLPARFAIPFALGCFLWAVAAPTGMALHLLGGILAAVLVLPLLLAARRRRERRRHQTFVTVEVKTADPYVTPEMERWFQQINSRFQESAEAPNIVKNSRKGFSRCVNYPPCKYIAEHRRINRFSRFPSPRSPRDPRSNRF